MKLDVVLISPGMPHDGATLRERSLGGSETAAILVAKHLAARGHHVTAFAPCQPRRIDDVAWLPIEQAGAYCVSTPHDVTVTSRLLDPLRFRLASALTILWCHDLALKRARAAAAGIAWNVSAVYVLSAYQRQQYEAVYGTLVPASLYHVTRNGIDLEAFRGRFPRRNPAQLCFGSRPERGLEVALAVMDELRRRGSPLHLHVAGYDNTTDQMRPYYEMLWRRADDAPNVTRHPPMRQADWRRLLATSAAMVYPGCAGDFREISCLVAMESMAAGTPVVTAGKGAVPETLGAARGPDGWACDTGVIVGDDADDCGSAAHVQRMADALVALHADPERAQRMGEAGRARAATLDWAGVAADWEAHWLSLLAARAADPWRMRRHLARIGEHEAAELPDGAEGTPP